MRFHRQVTPPMTIFCTRILWFRSCSPCGSIKSWGRCTGRPAGRRLTSSPRLLPPGHWQLTYVYVWKLVFMYKFIETTLVTDVIYCSPRSLKNYFHGKALHFLDYSKSRIFLSSKVLPSTRCTYILVLLVDGILYLRYFPDFLNSKYLPNSLCRSPRWC